MLALEVAEAFFVGEFELVEGGELVGLGDDAVLAYVDAEELEPVDSLELVLHEELFDEGLGGG